MNGNGNGKSKKRRRRIIYSVIAIVVLLVVVGGVIAATSGGTKIDPSKLAKVEKGDLAKSVVATGKIWPITQGRNQVQGQRHCEEALCRLRRHGEKGPDSL